MRRCLVSPTCKHRARGGSGRCEASDLQITDALLTLKLCWSTGELSDPGFIAGIKVADAAAPPAGARVFPQSGRNSVKSEKKKLKTVCCSCVEHKGGTNCPDMGTQGWGDHKGLAHHQKTPAPRLLAVWALATKLSLEQQRPATTPCFTLTAFTMNSDSLPPV